MVHISDHWGSLFKLDGGFRLLGCSGDTSGMVTLKPSVLISLTTQEDTHTDFPFQLSESVGWGQKQSKFRFMYESMYLLTYFKEFYLWERERKCSDDWCDKMWLKCEYNFLFIRNFRGNIWDRIYVLKLNWDIHSFSLLIDKRETLSNKMFLLWKGACQNGWTLWLYILTHFL